jgi:hypothetical protein
MIIFFYFKDRINPIVNNGGNSNSNIGVLFDCTSDITRAINNLNNLVNALGSDKNSI